MPIVRNVILGLLSILPSMGMAGEVTQKFDPNIHEKINDKYAMKNELLVAVQSDSEALFSLNQFNHTLQTKGLKIAKSEMISSDASPVKIIQLKLQADASLASSKSTVEHLANVKWVQPNYVYNINFDPRESTPNDPKIQSQYHHQLMGNTKAWDIASGRNVVVAVTDDGFDLKHEDLATSFIANKSYNFCDNNTKVTPGGFDGQHGTHVAGIVAAGLNNSKGGAGVAGNATVLPVKFYGHNCNWTSSLIYKAYQYAVDNGAKIISTSYSIDGFFGDKVFVAALDYGYNKGVLHFNSAGNNYQKDPKRLQFRELILVGSTDAHDVKSSFSNYGREMQISAPGSNILSTVPENRYQEMSGTSMATPNAAGSAALIWSLHPAWTRDQVAAQLIGTADNIDGKNPQYKNMLGSGRINTYRALTEKLAPTKVKDVVVTSSQGAGSNKKSVNLIVYFDKLLNPNVVNKGTHWEVKSLTDSSIIPASMNQPWFTGTMALKLSLPQLSPGKYQLTIKDSLKDSFGQALDGKGVGKAGGDYIYQFEV